MVLANWGLHAFEPECGAWADGCLLTGKWAIYMIKIGTIILLNIKMDASNEACATNHKCSFTVLKNVGFELKQLSMSSYVPK